MLQKKAPQPLDDEENEDSRKDLGFNFLSNNDRMIAFNAGRRASFTEEKDKKDDELDLAYRSDDTVYESSHQEISKHQHPMLRAAKLTKRIRKDARISQAQRKALKTRRNIITYRLRQKR